MKIIKECWQLVCKWFEYTLIRNTIILSTIFALIIHILFSVTAPCDFLEGEWGAGDILTYVSTIALGLLAFWQNQRFKEENDIAQDRLEHISREANELNLISQLSEVESQYISDLDAAFTDLFDSCSHETVSIILMHKYDATEISSALQHINQALTRFSHIYFSGYQLSHYDAKPLYKDSIELATNASIILRERLNSKQINSKKLEDSVDFYTNTTHEKEHYLSLRRKTHYRLLLEKLSLDEIRKIYVEPEELPNEQTET